MYLTLNKKHFMGHKCFYYQRRCTVMRCFLGTFFNETTDGCQVCMHTIKGGIWLVLAECKTSLREALHEAAIV